MSSPARTVPAKREQVEQSLGRALHRDMRFDAEATSVETGPDQAFAQRSGVCQDFAHVMIAGLRGLGLPAAYVSGYLRTIPPPPGYDPKAAFGPTSTREVVAKIKLLRIAKQGGRE